jgi:polyhydroxybutyrate depolymerase
LAAGVKVPLVIVLHDYGTTGDDMSALTISDEQATKGRFIVVYPEGVKGSWNAGACCAPATTSGIDDVKFIGLLIDRMTKQEPIDAARVFVVGFSNGAAMADRLACELAERIRAVTSVSGGMLVDSCRAASPVSLMEIHASNDRVFPIEGGDVGNVTVQSLATEIQQWVEIDGCTGSPVLGGTGVHKTSTWNTCANKSVVKLDIVEGEGHNWITNATGESWQFFSAIGSS